MQRMSKHGVVIEYLNYTDSLLKSWLITYDAPDMASPTKKPIGARVMYSAGNASLFPHHNATECLGTVPGVTKCTQDHEWVSSSVPSLDLPFRERFTRKSSPRVTLRLRGFPLLLGESGSAVSSGT